MVAIYYFLNRLYRSLFNNPMIHLLLEHYFNETTHAEQIEVATIEPFDLVFYLYRTYDNVHLVAIEGASYYSPKDMEWQLSESLGVDMVGWCVLKQFQEEKGVLLSTNQLLSQDDTATVTYTATIGKFTKKFALVKVKLGMDERSYGAKSS